MVSIGKKRLYVTEDVSQFHSKRKSKRNDFKWLLGKCANTIYSASVTTEFSLNWTEIQWIQGIW